MHTPAGLISLREAASAAGSRFGVTAEAAFDPCGLILFVPGESYPYWCTPQNVTQFATTGGDGVHYSYFWLPEPTGVCPIVMTVPMASSDAATCNLIVAESFEEFFSLGFHVGWFSLEQLIYQRVSALEYFKAPDAQQAEWCTQRLEFMREALSLQTKPPNEARLATLAAAYHAQLKLPADESAA